MKKEIDRHVKIKSEIENDIEKKKSEKGLAESQTL